MRQVRIGHRGGRLLHGERLAGERRFVDGEIHRRGRADVGGHAVPGAEHDRVAGHELARRHLRLDAAAQHVRQRRGHLAQRFERALGAILLHEPEQNREQHDDRDDHGLERVAHHPGQRGRDEQDDHQDVLELVDQRVPGGPARRRQQLVRAVLGQPALRLVGGEPGFGGREGAVDVGQLLRVPGGGGCRR